MSKSDDTISRQAALDAVDRVTESHNSVDAMKICAKVRLELLTLPPEEPEIIRCKDCKNYYLDEDGRGYHCERDSNVRFSVHKDFYCGDAERRTDE